MKKALLILSLLAMATVSLAVDSNIDIKKSGLTWVGTKIVGSHTGGLKFKTGKLKFEEKKLTGGEFIVDMTSLSNTDLEGEWKDKLLGHLKSPDFFSVKKYKTAKLTIEQVKRKNGNIFEFKGKLTIKGVTKDVKFDGILTDVDGKVSAKGKIIFDRTAYGIKYKSGKFFEGLGDKLIHDKVTVDFMVVAKSK